MRRLLLFGVLSLCVAALLDLRFGLGAHLLLPEARGMATGIAVWGILALLLPWLMGEKDAPAPPAVTVMRPAAPVLPAPAQRALPPPQTVDGLVLPARRALPGPGAPAGVRERRFEVVGEKEAWLDEWR